MTDTQFDTLMAASTSHANTVQGLRADVAYWRRKSEEMQAEAQRLQRELLEAECERLTAERDGLMSSLRNEMDENITVMIERVIAERDALRAFVGRVATQKPEKPDFWSGCGQCEHNISDARDLMETRAALSGKEQAS